MFNKEMVVYIEKSLINLSLNLNDAQYNKLQIACINQITAFLTRLLKKAKINKDDFSLVADLNSFCFMNKLNILDLCILCGFADLGSRLITNGVESKNYKILIQIAEQDPSNEINQSILAMCNMIENSMVSSRKSSFSSENELFPNLSSSLINNKYVSGYFALGGACVAGAILIHNPITWFGFASVGIPAIFAGINSMQNHEARINTQQRSDFSDIYKQNITELERMLSLATDIRNSIVNEAKLKELKELLRSRSISKTNLISSPQVTYGYEMKLHPNEDIVTLEDRESLKLTW